MQSVVCCVPSQTTSGAHACHWRCAPGVVDDLLRTPGAATGEEVDLLLDLRWRLHRREDAAAALRIFCDLRRRMEARHYLAFFRMRRWLETHVRASVRSCPLQAPVHAPLRLDYYCLEAINRSVLCAAVARGLPLLAPRVSYEFRPLSQTCSRRPPDDARQDCPSASCETLAVPDGASAAA